MEDKDKKINKCECGNDCTCEETCECGNDCTCEDKCECGNDCTCEETCECGDDCECGFDTNEYVELIQKLTKENKEATDAVLRSQAELINYRKRKDDEVNKIYKYASEGIIKEILPTIDNFERAILLDDENLNDELSKFLSGFKMIYASLKNVLEKHEVKEISSKEDEFDPTYHQAVLTEKIEGMESGKIIDILQKGYMLKDKVIRPAMVKVSE